MSRKTKALTVVLLFFVYSIYGTILTTLGIQIPVINPSHVDLSSAIFQLALEFILVCLFAFLYRRDMKDMCYDFKQHFGKYMKMIFLLWLLVMVMNIVINGCIVQIFDIDAPNNLLQQKLLDVAPIYLIFSMLLTTPFIEECVFRLSFHEILEHNKWFYIIMSGVVYGIFYIIFSFTQNLQLLYILSFAFFGGCLAYAYQKTENIFVPLGIHLLQNVLFIVMNLL